MYIQLQLSMVTLSVRSHWQEHFNSFAGMQREVSHMHRSAQYSCEIYYVKNFNPLPQAVTAINDFHSKLTVHTYGNHACRWLGYQVMVLMVISAQVKVLLVTSSLSLCKYECCITYNYELSGNMQHFLVLILVHWF